MININPINVDGVQPLNSIDKTQIQRNNDAIRDTNVRENAVTVKISDLAKDFSKAVQELAQEEEIRPEMVEKGRQLMELWTEPSSSEVDVIINNMTSE